MALRISRKACTLGRPGALGAGIWGSIQDHSASDKSVWYALLMLGTLPSRCLRIPFRTVSRDRMKSPYRVRIEPFGLAKIGQRSPIFSPFGTHQWLLRRFLSLFHTVSEG